MDYLVIYRIKFNFNRTTLLFYHITLLLQVFISDMPSENSTGKL